MAGIPVNHFEAGREFHGYRKGLYMYPCDEAEMERLDILHNLFIKTFGDLHRAPIAQPITEDTRILDLGTGSGIWAIDVADKYPQAEVIGIDLVNKQPKEIPPNLRFRVPRDYESPWTLGEDSWDLIYLRLACGGVSQWSEMYQNIFRHLKPGVGHLEQLEIDFEPRCDDGPVPERLATWWQYLKDASARGGKPLQFNRNTRPVLESHGFVDVEEHSLKLPLNDWSTEEPARSLGAWNAVIFNDGIEAMSLGPLTRVYQWPAEDARMFCREIREIGTDRRVHCYQTIHLFTARRP